MGSRSQYPLRANILGTDELTGIIPAGTELTPGGDFNATANTLLTTDAAKAAFATLFASGVLEGADISITPNVDGTFTVASTASAGSSYDPAVAIADVGAATIGEEDYIDVTVPVAGTIQVATAQALKDRLQLLEGSTLIKVIDNISGGGTSYATFPGTTGSYIDTPSTTALQPSGNTDIRVRCAPDLWKPASNQYVASKWASVSNGSWILRINATTGFLSFLCTTNGTATQTAVSTSAPPGVDGQPLWIRALRNGTDGQVNFYWAPDQVSEPTTWNTVTLDRGTAIGALTTSTIGVAAGASNSGATNPFAGKIYRMTLRNAGTLVADMDTTGYTSGTSWVGALGNTWTLHGGVTMSTGGGTGILTNTSTQNALATLDAQSAIGVGLHDMLIARFAFTFINTTGAAANFTLQVKLNGVTLFDLPAVSIVNTSAGQVRNGQLIVYIETNTDTGTSQIAGLECKISNAVTGTDLGSQTCATTLADISGVRGGTITTYTTVPSIQLMLTMATASASISARPVLSQLFMAQG